MNEITKLYKNADIKTCKRKQGFTLKDCTDRDCKECGYYICPPFTAEKQIELIKWLSKEYGYKITLNFVSDEHRITIDKHRELGKFCQKCDEYFEQALAGLINNIRQDLTEEEKQQIKNILEG